MSCLSQWVQSGILWSICACLRSHVKFWLRRRCHAQCATCFQDHFAKNEDPPSNTAQLRGWIGCCLCRRRSRGLVRLEEVRVQKQQQLQRWSESVATGVDVNVSTLGGRSWCVRAAMGMTGAELKMRVAALSELPESELTLVCGATTITDDEKPLLTRTILMENSVRQLQLLRMQRNFALSGSCDKTVKLWDLDKAVCLETLRGHRCFIKSVVVDWVSQCALTGSADGVLLLWDLSTATCIETLCGHENAVICIVADWDLRRALSASIDRIVKLWDLDHALCLETLKGQGDPIQCIALDLASQSALTGAADGVLKLWDLGHATCLGTLHGHVHAVTCIAVDWEARCAISGCNGGTLRLWNVDHTTSVELLREQMQPAHVQPVTCLAIAWNTGCALSGCNGGGLMLWDLGRGTCMGVLQEHGESPICCIAAEWGLRQVLSGSGDGTLKLWDLDNIVCIQTLHGHRAPIGCVATTRSAMSSLVAEP